MESRQEAVRAEGGTTGTRGNLLLPLALFAVAGLYFGLEAYFHRGLYARLYDWQFTRFGQALPAFDLALLIALALLVALATAALLRRRRPAAARNMGATLRSSNRFGRLLFILSAVAALLALGWLVAGLLLPTRGDPAQIVSPDEARPAPDGVRYVRGVADGRLMVSYGQDLLVWQRNAYLVPLIDPREPRTIRAFAEHLPAAGWTGDTPPKVDTGTPMRLYEHQLPGFVPLLYARAGYLVDRDAPILTTRSGTLRLPYFLAAAQLLLVSLSLLVAALLYRRHARRLAAPVA